MTEEKTLQSGTKKTVCVIFIAMLLIFVIFSGGVTLLKGHETYSYFENRELAEVPKLSLDGVLSGEYFSGIDSYISDRSAGRNTIIKLSTYADLYLLRRPVVNEILVADGGVLLAEADSEFDAEKAASDAATAAERLSSHAELCESYGGKFLYVALPTQDMVYEKNIPEYAESRIEALKKTGEIFFGALEEKNVDYIDMAGSLGTDDYSAVDHHYNIYGAYKTCLAIAERMGNIDIIGEGEFEYLSFDEPYLGSRARKLYGLYGSDEKLSVIVPDENVPFTRWFYGETIAATYYTAPTGEYASYDVYMGGDYAITKIDTGRSELPDILIYGDSFTNAVESIIWWSCGTMTSIDFRGYTGMTLEEYISEYKPDCVICIRDYSALLTLEGNGQ